MRMALARQLEQDNRALAGRLAQIAALVAGSPIVVTTETREPVVPVTSRTPTSAPARRLVPIVPRPQAAANGELHPAGRKLLMALAQHAPGRFTWGQAATLAGLKPSGGHFNAGRKSLRESGYIAEINDLLAASPAGLTAAGEVPPQPSTPAERLALWCGRLPSPAPEMLRLLAAQGDRAMDAADLAAALGKKPTGGHWNAGIAVLRNNGLIEADGRRLRAAELLRAG
jgi:hypothetical protein